MDARHGIVYLAEEPDRDLPFGGYWDAGDPPALLEAGPGWATAAEAVAWGRQRARVVLLRLLTDGYVSAGEQQPRGEGLPEWREGSG
jgi:hypothetical protein